MARDEHEPTNAELAKQIEDVRLLVEKVELSINSRMTAYISKIEEAAEQSTQLARLLGAEAERATARQEAQESVRRSTDTVDGG